MPRRFPPTTETSAGSLAVPGDARYETPNRSSETDFFVPPPAYDAYERIHKRLVGPKTADKLLWIHDELTAISLHTDYLTVAGWAAAEAALVATDRPQEDRLAYLDLASKSWNDAVACQRARNLDRGLTEDYQHANIGRLQLPSVFLPLMEGMIRGDVSKQVRAKVYDNLLFLAAQNSVGLVDATKNHRECGPHIGLGHEINAMLAVNRLQSPTLIAMPALARADSGRFHPQQTHDIDLLHLNWGEVTGVTTIESKARPKEKHYKRYEAAIVGGKIHLYTKNGVSPIDTVLLFLKEQDGVITDEERTELEDMTDVIVHLARHQLADKPDIPPHCRDVARCDKVPRHRSGNFFRGLGGLAVAS
jgi:hypothetical protein